MTKGAMDPEDLWDAHEAVLYWRDSDNCDDTPEHRKRLLELANRLKSAAVESMKATGDTPELKGVIARV